jgi:hypothetical protein
MLVTNAPCPAPACLLAGRDAGLQVAPERPGLETGVRRPLCRSSPEARRRWPAPPQVGAYYLIRAGGGHRVLTAGCRPARREIVVLGGEPSLQNAAAVAVAERGGGEEHNLLLADSRTCWLYRCHERGDSMYRTPWCPHSGFPDTGDVSERPAA